ncbi:MAG: TIM barrel protein [Phycisphaeraceae bacterium]
MQITRRQFTQRLLVTGAGLHAVATRAVAADEQRMNNRLFIMDTWFWGDQIPFDQQVELLAELGVKAMLLSGLHHVTPGNLQLLDDHDIALEAVYHVANPEEPASDRLLDVIARLQGRDTLIALAMSSKAFGTSDLKGDGSAIRHVKAYADAAEEAGLSVAFYPHAGFWLERVADGVRLAQKIDRPNVGAIFNLYHWLARDAEEVTLDQTLDEALPYLKAVTINGAQQDTARIPVNDAILPLDQGNYDLRPLMRKLAARQYAGPIGLQGYSIQGDVPGKLQRSVETYQALTTLR